MAHISKILIGATVAFLLWALGLYIGAYHCPERILDKEYDKGYKQAVIDVYEHRDILPDMYQAAKDWRV